ncbi:ACYPI005624 protein, partial [Aphis craccivora]
KERLTFSLRSEFNRISIRLHTQSTKAINAIINMYKIVFVVCVFAFALQGAFSSPVAENEPALQGEKLPNPEIQKNAVVQENEETTASTTVTQPSVSSTTPKNGASSSEICILLVQVSSLALIAKQMLL